MSGAERQAFSSTASNVLRPQTNSGGSQVFSDTEEEDGIMDSPHDGRPRQNLFNNSTRNFLGGSSANTVFTPSRLIRQNPFATGYSGTSRRNPFINNSQRRSHLFSPYAGQSSTNVCPPTVLRDNYSSGQRNLGSMSNPTSFPPSRRLMNLSTEARTSSSDSSGFALGSLRSTSGLGANQQRSYPTFLSSNPFRNSPFGGSPSLTRSSYIQDNRGLNTGYTSGFMHPPGIVSSHSSESSSSNRDITCEPRNISSLVHNKDKKMIVKMFGDWNFGDEKRAIVENFDAYDANDITKPRYAAWLRKFRTFCQTMQFTANAAWKAYRLSHKDDALTNLQALQDEQGNGCDAKVRNAIVIMMLHNNDPYPIKKSNNLKFMTTPFPMRVNERARQYIGRFNEACAIHGLTDDELMVGKFVVGCRRGLSSKLSHETTPPSSYLSRKYPHTYWRQDELIRLEDFDSLLGDA